MQFVPLFDTELGCASFVIGDESTGFGFVVDPLEAVGVDTYILTAQDVGLSVTRVFETHVHADHASCARQLAEAVSARLCLSRNAPSQFPYEPLTDGQQLAFGAVQVTVWETPGHTPDSISLVVKDHNRGSGPRLVLTGDSLFVGDVGRPDLVDATAEGIQEASRQQYHTVHRLMTLPDYTEVWPAHYGASPCGGLFMSPTPHTTIGYERINNRMLNLEDEAAFLDYQRRLVKQAPPEAQALRAKNLGA